MAPILPVIFQPIDTEQRPGSLEKDRNCSHTSAWPVVFLLHHYFLQVENELVVTIINHHMKTGRVIQALTVLLAAPQHANKVTGRRESRASIALCSPGPPGLDGPPCSLSSPSSPPADF